MKNFAIVDMVNKTQIRTVQAQNGKSALRKFKQTLMNTGMYEIHKSPNNGNWILLSTYGSYFTALPI